MKLARYINEENILWDKNFIEILKKKCKQFLNEFGENYFYKNYKMSGLNSILSKNKEFEAIFDCKEYFAIKYNMNI